MYSVKLRWTAALLALVLLLGLLPGVSGQVRAQETEPGFGTGLLPTLPHGSYPGQSARARSGE